MLCCADHVLKEWRKKTKNDAATRLASVLHAVSKMVSVLDCTHRYDDAGLHEQKL